MRRAFSLVEVAVGLLVIALAVAALGAFGSGEVRGVEHSLDRLAASVALEELQACLGGMPLGWYREAFPESAAGFGPQHAARIAAHPLLHSASATAASSRPAARWIQAELARLEATRMVLFTGISGEGGLQAGIVTFVVRWRGPGGTERELSSFEVVR